MSESGRGQKGGVCMVGRNQELGRIWQTLWIPKIAVRLDSDLFLSSARISFLPPFYPFSRMPFGAHRSPFSIFTSFSHNYILLYKKPCSPPAKSLSLLVTFLHWSVLLSGWGDEAAPNQAALETLARSRAGLLPYGLVKEWQAFPHVCQQQPGTSKCISHHECAVGSGFPRRLFMRNRDQL